MEEKLKKKEIKQYKVIFEETNLNITTTKDIEYESNRKTQIKSKNRDFTWITLWDLPLDYSKQEISRLVKYFGYAEEIILKKLRYYQYAEIKIFTREKNKQENSKQTGQ